MPEDSKGPESVSPLPEGAKAPAEGVTSDQPQAAPPAPAAEVKQPAAASVASESKPTESAKPAAPAPAAKPAAPAATAAKPPAAPAKPAGPVPEPWESEMVVALKQQYGSGIVESLSYLGQKYITVDISVLSEILRRMHDNEGFDYCVDITAVHYPKREQQFDIVYVLYSFSKNERIRVKTRIKDGDRLPSAYPIWPTANWLEREVFDMFGIVFDGHPG